jgi:large-conductance mechanosensitive channel
MLVVIPNYVAFIISFLISAIIGFFWVRGIDNMKKNHPNYKGEDFLQENKKEEKIEEKNEKKENTLPI